jgi:hypothetical protein
MKLYYGGFGNFQDFTVAEDEAGAIKNLGVKINAPFLPITAKEIDAIDGYSIVPVLPGDTPEEKKPAAPTATVRRCKKCDWRRRKVSSSSYFLPGSSS